MHNSQAMNAYQHISTSSGIDSASPQKLIQMLLDGALENIAAAKGNLMRSETAAKGERIGKAISIVEGLRTSLDLDAGELSDNLQELYQYVGRRLVEANMNDNVTILDEVADLLNEIKSAWDVVAVERVIETQQPA